MNNLKSMKGGASLRNLKRLLCLLLVLTMLPINAFAASGAGTGTDPVRPGTGSSTGFGWKQRSDAMGFALGIQQMQGSDYTIKPPTEQSWVDRPVALSVFKGGSRAPQHLQPYFISYACTDQQPALRLLTEPLVYLAHQPCSIRNCNTAKHFRQHSECQDQTDGSFVHQVSLLSANSA